MKIPEPERILPRRGISQKHVTNSEGQIMKRDMDVIRKILTSIENGVDPYMRFIEREEVYNVVLLADAGLLKAHFKDVPGRGVTGATVERLTWNGHEFLDAIRDNEIWAKAKDIILRDGSSWTFSILMDFISEEAKSRKAAAKAG